MPSLFRVLLAEDHPLLRQAVVSLLTDCCDVVGTIDRGDLVVHAVRQKEPDGLVLDISMPGRSGLQLIPELRASFPNLALVVLTNHDSQHYRERALLYGADGYVSKVRAADELWPALEAAFVRRGSSEQVLVAMAGC